MGFAERFREAAEAARAKLQEHGGGAHMQCTTATGLVRLQAREKRYNTVEGFDTRSCEPHSVTH